jgi:hypothetical protein
MQRSETSEHGCLSGQEEGKDHMRRKIAAFIVAVMLGVGAAAVVATPAQAAQSDCWYGYVCLWSGGEPFTGTIYRIPAMPRGYCFNVASSFNDRGVHFYNRLSQRYVEFWDDAGCTGHQLHKNVPGCPLALTPGQGSGEFWWDTAYTL